MPNIQPSDACARNTYRQNATARSRILNSPREVDTVVIGGGLTALQAAVDLQKAGQKAVVLAPATLSRPIADTGCSFEIAEPPAYAAWYQEMGREPSSLAAAAYHAAIGELEAVSTTCQECHIARVPTFFVAEHARELMSLERECSIARALKGDCWFEREVQLPFHCAGAVRDNHQVRLLQAPLLLGLAAEFQRLGGQLLEHSPMLEPPILADICEVKSDHGVLHSKNILFTERAPAGFSAKLTSLHSYAIIATIAEPLSEPVYVLGDNPRRMIWIADPEDATKVVIRSDYFGEQVASQPRRFDELCCYAASRLSVRRIDSRWSTHRLVAHDRLPIVGRLAHHQNVYLGIGMGASELPWATLSGKLLASLIQGRENQPGYAASLDPMRSSLRRESGEGAFGRQVQSTAQGAALNHKALPPFSQFHRSVAQLGFSESKPIRPSSPSNGPSSNPIQGRFGTRVWPARDW